MRIETIGKTQQLINCDGCGHPVYEGQPILSDIPEQVPEDFPREAFRHFHTRCYECGANSIPCYQLYASRQVPFTSQVNADCNWCGHSIHAGQDVLRDSFFIWNITGDAEDNGVASGAAAGVASPPKYQGPFPFNDLPRELKRDFRIAGLRNGRGYRTGVEPEQFYHSSVPRQVRVFGQKAIRRFKEGKDASHIESVVNAPDKVKTSSNFVWERRHWNRSRGPANMKSWEKVRAHTMNGADAARIVGKNALVNARKAMIWACVLEALVSATEGAISVDKGKMSKKDATKKAAMNTAKSGAVGGATAGGFTALAALGAGPILAAASIVLMPIGFAIYGVSSVQRIRAAMHDPNLLQRVPFYFHTGCSDCGTGLSCFEKFAAEMSRPA